MLAIFKNEMGDLFSQVCNPFCIRVKGMGLFATQIKSGRK
jgi:hypothetical protein